VRGAAAPAENGLTRAGLRVVVATRPGAAA